MQGGASVPRTARLSRDDWAAAALDALEQGGAAAVAIEPVAARLGASKSSCYWLFANREALLEAALDRWEHVQTDRVIAWLAGIPEPAERLRALVRGALASVAGADLALSLLAELRNAADVSDAAAVAVRRAVDRVSRRRLAAIEAIFTDLGHPAEHARHLAAAGYSVYLGTAALRRIDAAPADTDAYVDAVLAALLR
jgi:AcrR family transcriptional regulator